MKLKAWQVSGVMLLTLAACGGGGGAPSSPTPTPTPVVSLLPAAPALGATLYADATSLRPLRDGAVWRYRGTQTSPLVAGSPVAYTTATTQAATSASAATENLSNTGNAGPDTQPLSDAAARDLRARHRSASWRRPPAARTSAPAG